MRLLVIIHFKKNIIKKWLWYVLEVNFKVDFIIKTIIYYQNISSKTSYISLIAIPIPIAGTIISGANIVAPNSPTNPNPDNAVAPSTNPVSAAKPAPAIVSDSNTPSVSGSIDSVTAVSVEANA
jgi:hypothetical protein